MTTHAPASAPDRIELLPCPFCGGDALIQKQSLGAWRGVAAHCIECTATGPGEHNEKDAAGTWNTRAAMTPSASGSVEDREHVSQLGRLASPRVGETGGIKGPWRQLAEHWNDQCIARDVALSEARAEIAALNAILDEILKLNGGENCSWAHDIIAAHRDTNLP